MTVAVLYQLRKHVSKDSKVCAESIWFLIAFQPFKNLYVSAQLQRGADQSFYLFSLKRCCCINYAIFVLMFIVGSFIFVRWMTQREKGREGISVSLGEKGCFSFLPLSAPQLHFSPLPCCTPFLLTPRLVSQHTLKRWIFIFPSKITGYRSHSPYKQCGSSRKVCQRRVCRFDLCSVYKIQRAAL